MHPDQVRRALNNRAGEIWTTLPGAVVLYTPATRSVVVQPQISTPVLEDELVASVEVPPQIPDVPVWMPAGGTCAITWDLVPGDTGLLVYSMRDPALWQIAGGIVAPNTLALHGATPLCFLPGLLPDVQGAALAAQASTPGIVVAGPMVTLGGPTAVKFVVIADAASMLWFSQVQTQLAAVAAFGIGTAPTALPPTLATKVKGE